LYGPVNTDAIDVLDGSSLTKGFQVLLTTDY
jgi:hypothetical protein